MKKSLLTLAILTAFFLSLCATHAQLTKTLVYAALPDEGNLAIVDPYAGKIIQRIQIGRVPDYVALNDDATKLYVSNTGDVTVSLVNLAEARVSQVFRLPTNRRGVYSGVLVKSWDGQKIFVAEHAEDPEEPLRIYVIDTKREIIVAKFDAGKKISALAVSNDNKKIFVVNQGEGVGVFDAETYQNIGKVEPLQKNVATIFSIGSSPAAPKAIITYGPANKVQVINTDTYKTEATIEMPKYKTGEQRDVFFGPDGKNAFVVNHKVAFKDEYDGINVIDLAKNEVIKIFNAGIVNRGMACTPDGKIFYCAALDLKWYNVPTLEHLRSISLRTKLAGIAITVKEK